MSLLSDFEARFQEPVQRGKVEDLGAGPTRVKRLSVHLGTSIRGYTIAWDVYAADGPLEAAKGPPLLADTAGVVLMVSDPKAVPAQIVKMKAQLGKAVLGHDVCLVLYAPKGGDQVAALGYPVISEEQPGVGLLKALAREVLRAEAGRGCGVADGPAK